MSVDLKMLRDHSSIMSSNRWVGGVRKWQFLMIYRTLNLQRGGWVGLKKLKTWWHNTWMVPNWNGNFFLKFHEKKAQKVDFFEPFWGFTLKTVLGIHDPPHFTITLWNQKSQTAGTSLLYLHSFFLNFKPSLFSIFESQ